jgi:hypothetical protein
MGLQFNEHPEKMVSVENAVNMQPEFSNGGRTQVILRSTPGRESFSLIDADAARCRGFAYVGDVLYTVMGKSLYAVTSDGLSREIGRIDGTGVVALSASGEELYISTGVSNYNYVITTDTLSGVTTAPIGFTNTFLNGRFVTEDPTATGPTAGRFYWSDLLDATAWNALDYATAEQKPDRTIRVEAYGNVLIVAGAESIEYWRGDAAGFLPITGTTQPIGLAGRYAMGQIDNQVCFLANDGSVRTMNGYQTIPISTPAVEAALNADPNTECVTYREQGHTIFEFSTASITLCYDAAQSKLLGRNVWFEKRDNEGRNNISASIFAFGKNLVGSISDGTIYELTRSAYPDAREFTLPSIADDQSLRWNKLDGIELICRTGTGAIPDEQPKMMLRVSRDNGYTYGEERWADMGTIGHYATRVKWRRFGRFLNMNLNFRLTDQTELTVMGVNANGG